MWTASPRTPTRRFRASERGLTLVEMAIVVALIGTMALIMERTMDQSNKASLQADAVRRLADKGQRAIYRMREIVSESRRMFDRDAVGQAYFDALDLSRDAVLPGARLPITDPTTHTLSIDDPAEPQTGNILLFVRDSDPAPAVANPATGKTILIDTYRFVCIYPSLTNVNVMPGVNPAGVFSRDLVIWRSEIYPSYSQVRAIQDPAEQQSVVQDLYSRYGNDVLWDSARELSNSFFPSDALGNVSATPLADMTIEEDVTVSERGLLVYADIQLADSDLPNDFNRRPVFTSDDPTMWTPSGIEFKVVGPSGSRRVWMRIVLETASSARQVVVQPFSLIASARVY